MKILCIGEALIDMICTDTGFSLDKGDHFLKKPGGAPTNVAAAIASLGGTVLLAAKVGNDPFGKQLINTMKDFGVATELMFEDPDHFTTCAFVSLLQDGQRDFVFNRGADGHLTEEEIETIDLKDFSIIHFGSATGFLKAPLQKAYLSLLNRGNDEKKFISFDPNHRQLLFPQGNESFIKQSWHFLKNCNFFKLSDDEALLITKTKKISEAATILSSETNAVFTITLGKEGTMLVFNNKQIIVPSIPVKSIDSTGAGDAFVGAVLYQINKLSFEQINNLDQTTWENIITNANKAGGRTCEYMGAMEAFKHLNLSIFN